MGELDLTAGIQALGGRGRGIEELRECGEDGLWSEVADGVEVVEFAILAAKIVAVRKVQGSSGQAQAGAQEADIGEVDFSVEKRGLGGGKREGEVAVLNFIKAGQGFFNERGFGIQVGEVVLRAHACRRLQDVGEAKREGVFQPVDAGIYDGGIEACELLLERVCVRLAGKERGSVEENQRGVIRHRLQSSLEGLVSGFKRFRGLLRKGSAACLEAGLSACEWRCRESQNQDEE